jgi:hypothetical protein
MNSTVPPCRTITVFAFRGDRSRNFAAAFQRALRAERNGIGPGPTSVDWVLFAGHTGVSTDGGATIFGFNPDRSGLPAWQLMDKLKNGDAFPGVVSNDTSMFSAAQKHGLTLLSFGVIMPDPQSQDFAGSLDAERQSSHYSYGFPDGDGDCNCTTWLERLGLPLLTGRMDEFVALVGISSRRSRRFGECV